MASHKANLMLIQNQMSKLEMGPDPTQPELTFDPQ